MQPPEQYRCLRCRRVLPRAEFYERPDKPNWPRPVCKDCWNKQSLRYYATHKESWQARDRAWRAAHPERVQEYSRRAAAKAKARRRALADARRTVADAAVVDPALEGGTDEGTIVSLQP